VVGHFLFGFVLWWVLIAIGQFLRGRTGRSTGPGKLGSGKDQEEQLWSFPWWIGAPGIAAYFTAASSSPAALALLYAVSEIRYNLVMILTLCSTTMPIKIFLRLSWE